MIVRFRFKLCLNSYHIQYRVSQGISQANCAPCKESNCDFKMLTGTTIDNTMKKRTNEWAKITKCIMYAHV